MISAVTVKLYGFAAKSYSRQKIRLWHNEDDNSSAAAAAGQNCAKYHFTRRKYHARQIFAVPL
jgi:hypothetical protein